MTTLSVSGSEKNRKARTKGWVWDIPYCMACKRHVRQAEGLYLFALGLGAVSFASAFLVGIASSSWISGLLALGLSLPTGFLISLAFWILIRNNRPVNCTVMTRAVLYIGSAGSFHTFEFRPGFYGSEFIRANHRKIVNASTLVASILKDTSFGDFQVARRLVRRKQ